MRKLRTEQVGYFFMVWDKTQALKRPSDTLLSMGHSCPSHTSPLLTPSRPHSTCHLAHALPFVGKLFLPSSAWQIPIYPSRPSQKCPALLHPEPLVLECGLFPSLFCVLFCGSILYMWNTTKLRAQTLFRWSSKPSSTTYLFGEESEHIWTSAASPVKWSELVLPYRIVMKVKWVHTCV